MMPCKTSSPLRMLRLTWLMAGTAAVLLTTSSAAHAQVVLAPLTPQVGSSNPVTAEPLVSRPSTTPCIVPLFQNVAFADYSPKFFPYAPPTGCAGPWAKVVLTADFTVTAGRQFDRTAALYLGHANLYFGTTAEPRHALSPSWHVERDVTDYSSLFKTAQDGQADIFQVVNSTYTSTIYASAALEFYPTSPGSGAPVTADIVVPVNGPGGDAGAIDSHTTQITQILNLPTNIERVYLDVIAQSQSSEEQWFMCVPTAEDVQLETYCGNTAFRETEVTIDGKPAGVAPVYPWIYTGGLDPYLWEPITGLQTLDFKPYRVDLTPFAGLLSDGNTHTVAVGVFNAYGYFNATANLLAYMDHGSQKVTGGILSNTLSAAPTPEVIQNIHTYKDGPTYVGSVNVISNRDFTIAGYVNTSHGRVDTTVQQTVDFKSAQQFNVSPAKEQQHAHQTSTVDSITTTSDNSFVNTAKQHFSFPIDIDYLYVVNKDGSAVQTVFSDQKYQLSQSTNIDGLKLYDSKTDEEVESTDSLLFETNGSYHALGDKAKAEYRYSDSLGHCYNRTLVAASTKLTSVADGVGCGGNQSQ